MTPAHSARAIGPPRGSKAGLVVDRTRDPAEEGQKGTDTSTFGSVLGPPHGSKYGLVVDRTRDPPVNLNFIFLY